MTTRSRLARLAVRLDPAGRSSLARLAVRADEAARARAEANGSGAPNGRRRLAAPAAPLGGRDSGLALASAATADAPGRRRIVLGAWVAAGLLAFGGAFAARTLDREPVAPVAPAALVAEPVGAAAAPAPSALEPVAPLPRIRPPEPRPRRAPAPAMTPAAPPPAPAPAPAPPAEAGPAPAPAPAPAPVVVAPAPAPPAPAPQPEPSPPRETFDSEG